MRRLPAELLESPVQGLNLTGATLRDQLNPNGQTLLVFLRHFGCIFCREMVADLRKISRATPDYPPILFFYQGTLEEGEAFMRKLWAQARAIADLPKRFYDAFGLERGTLGRCSGRRYGRAACGLPARGISSADPSATRGRCPVCSSWSKTRSRGSTTSSMLAIIPIGG